VIEAAGVLGSGEFALARDLSPEVVLTPPKSSFTRPRAISKVRQQAERYAVENALLWAN
jgi:hypothetical protein